MSLSTAAAVAAAATPAMRRSTARLVSAAPMMDYTDPFFRALQRLVSRRALLYTEMHVSQALLRMDAFKLRHFLGPRRDSYNGPVALQIGGADAVQAGAAVARVWGDGYRFGEVNINCGCPSEKAAGAGKFGAALMDEPALVAAMARTVADSTRAFGGDGGGCGSSDSMPPPEVTVKCRLGIARPSQFDAEAVGDWPRGGGGGDGGGGGKRRMLQFFRGEAPPEFVEERQAAQFAKLCEFVRTVSEGAPVRHFIVHAREAALDCKLGPKSNRTVPPLDYDAVHRLSREFPHLSFALNGGVSDVEAIRRHLGHCDVPGGRSCLDGDSDGGGDRGGADATPRSLLDGVMVGRVLMHDAFFLRGVDELIYEDSAGQHTGTHAASAAVAAAEAAAPASPREPHGVSTPSAPRTDDDAAAAAAATAAVWRAREAARAEREFWDFRGDTLRRYAEYADQRIVDTADDRGHGHRVFAAFKPLMAGFHEVRGGKKIRGFVAEELAQARLRSGREVDMAGVVDRVLEMARP